MRRDFFASAVQEARDPQKLPPRRRQVHQLAVAGAFGKAESVADDALLPFEKVASVLEREPVGMHRIPPSRPESMCSAATQDQDLLSRGPLKE